ncbi:MAG: DUF1571 domain-containing protein [Pirellulales bacterium]|nr:DUF1571 domain-containing protein [Pirellulales bacterium]
MFAAGTLAQTAAAQQPQPTLYPQPQQPSVYSANGAGLLSPRLAQKPEQPPLQVATPNPLVANRLSLRSVIEAGPAAPGEHPLMPALRWAESNVEHIRAIEDYQCEFVKRERIDGELKDYQYLFIKVRHRPFSVYTYFRAPSALKGQEAIFVTGRNENKLVAHGTGYKNRVLGTLELDPNGWVAMRDNRYPVTEIGMLNLTEKLIAIGRADTQYGECEVVFRPNTKINGRSCTCIEVKHPVPRRNFRFHLAQIFVDDELVVPVRYAAYEWPKTPGGKPELVEEYTYLNLKLNNGFTDSDFDPANGSYGYPQ